MGKGLATKEKIIRKSAELFNIFGYHGCALSHIMAATKLQKGGIYNHFRNKDEIALEAFDYNFNRMIKRFRKRLDRDRTAREKLNSVIEVFASLGEDPLVKGGGCPIFNTAVDSTNTHPELTKKAKEGIKTLKRYIEIKIEEGMKAREFVNTTNAEEISTLIISSLEGAIIMSRVNQDLNYVAVTENFLKKYIEDHVIANNYQMKVGDAKQVAD